MLALEALISEDLLCLLKGNHLADERLVGLHDFGHLLLDCLEVVGRDVLRQGEVIVIAVVGRRAVGNLRTGEQLLHGFRHDMCARVAHKGKRLGAFGGNDLDGIAVGNRGGNVNHLAVDLAG